MKIENRVPTLQEMILVSGIGELQATGCTLGNSIDIEITTYNKAGKCVAYHSTFGRNLSGLIAQSERILKRMNKHNSFVIVLTKG